MLNLQALVVAPELAQLLQLRRRRLVHLYTLRHDLALARLLAPTRQHEGMNVKRLRDLLHTHPAQLAQSNRGGFESIAVLVRCPGTCLLYTSDAADERSS